MTGSLPKRIQISALLLLALLCWGCGGSSSSDSPELASDLEEGRALAYRHCIACHQVPEPDLLTKRSWEYALTYMGFFLGVVDYQWMEGSEEFARDSIHLREEFVRDAGMIPEHA